MSKKKEPSKLKTGKKGGKLLPALCSILGTLIILFVIAVAAPLTLPRLLGYEIYNVVSGSMEPEIPVGSAVYIKSIDPVELQAGDVIAFLEESSTVTHRVVENHVIARELVTKGDANESSDFDPVMYENVIGKVEHHVPVVGNFMMMLSGTAGKIYLLALAICGALFNILAARLREKNLAEELVLDEDFLRQLSELEIEISEKKPAKKKKKKSRALRIISNIVMCVMLAVFLISAGMVLFIKHQYKISEELYEEAATTYTTVVSQPLNIEVPAWHPQEKYRLPEVAPIEVDFEGLLEINPDIVGWIYCPDTVINYPVLLGETNDTYLHHSYDKTYNAAGSIFIEEMNERDLSDCNYIIYGHHMGDKSMFATLDRWQNQGYFDEHPFMWLLTPEQDYKIALYSAYTMSAYDEAYTVYHEREPAFEYWLENSRQRSAVAADVALDPDEHYVMLSTCAYVFEDARSVVHGLLQPVSSAAGVPMKTAETTSEK